MRPLRTPTSAPLLAALALALLAVLAAPDAGALTAQHRLDRVGVPTSEALRLELHAAQTDYSGAAHLPLQVTPPAGPVGLHPEEPPLRKMERRATHGPAPGKWAQ